jgi:NodT family efflux transporter outer membrane factor (OMF) lipoprotein
MARLWKLAFLVPLLCTACRIGPRYQRPEAPVPTALKELADNDQWKMATPSDSLLKGKWWEVFDDPQLNALEELVDIQNQNIKQAEAQFREARALVATNHANYFPTIGVTPAYTEEDVGKNTGRGLGGTSQAFSIPALATWEPDLWGRVRLSVENASANAQVSAADLQNLRLSEQALLATDYFSLAAQDMQEAVLVNTIEAYAKNLQLTEDRYSGGVASKSDITLAQTQLAGAKAQATDVHITRSQFEHAVAVLTGQLPSAITISTTKIGAPPPSIPLVVPSRLLERRPDIAANERQVAAANASIGIAKTAYYPTLTLSAAPGLLSSNLSNLFNYSSRAWSVGPSLSYTVFDFGRRHAQVVSSEASYDGTVAAYRQTVLSAFQEVEDDLSDLRYLAEEAVQQQEAVVAAQEALELEIERYKAGTDSYLNVVTTQVIALTDQQNAISILDRRMTAAVDLIKAVGGGWDASALPSGSALRSLKPGDSTSAPSPSPTAAK